MSTIAMCGSPVAVYIDQWTDTYIRGGRSSIPLIMINDLNKTVTGTVELLVDLANRKDFIQLRNSESDARWIGSAGTGV